jgi:hypothetical protein
MQMVAENWLVIDLGGSGLILGITSALQFAPLLLLSAYAGVLVDRRDTRRLGLFAQRLKYAVHRIFEGMGK